MSASLPRLTSRLEEAIFQSVLPQLEAEGFSVLVHPSKDMLPSFLSNYYPDAVAYKEGRKIAIEVLSESRLNGPKVERIRKIFLDHPEWELRLIYAPPAKVEEVIPELSRELIDEQLRRIEGSLDVMGEPAGLLIAWATFEAAARRLFHATFFGAQGPSRLIEVLASEGYITPDEADTLRSLTSIRNQVAHGRLDIAQSREQVERLIAITRSLLRLDA